MPPSYADIAAALSKAGVSRLPLTARVYLANRIGAQIEGIDDEYPNLGNLRSAAFGSATHAIDGWRPESWRVEYGAAIASHPGDWPWIGRFEQAARHGLSVGDASLFADKRAPVDRDRLESAWLDVGAIDMSTKNEVWKKQANKHVKAHAGDAAWLGFFFQYLEKYQFALPDQAAAEVNAKMAQVKSGGGSEGGKGGQLFTDPAYNPIPQGQIPGQASPRSAMPGQNPNRGSGGKLSPQAAVQEQQRRQMLTEMRQKLLAAKQKAQQAKWAARAAKPQKKDQVQAQQPQGQMPGYDQFGMQQGPYGYDQFGNPIQMPGYPQGFDPYGYPPGYNPAQEQWQQQGPYLYDQGGGYYDDGGYMLQGVEQAIFPDIDSAARALVATAYRAAPRDWGQISNAEMASLGRYPIACDPTPGPTPIEGTAPTLGWWPGFGPSAEAEATFRGLTADWEAFDRLKVGTPGMLPHLAQDRTEWLQFRNAWKGADIDSSDIGGRLTAETIRANRIRRELAAAKVVDPSLVGDRQGVDVMRSTDPLKAPADAEEWARKIPIVNWALDPTKPLDEAKKKLMWVVGGAAALFLLLFATRGGSTNVYLPAKA